VLSTEEKRGYGKRKEFTNNVRTKMLKRREGESPIKSKTANGDGK